MVRTQNFGNSAAKALDRAVGLGPAREDEAVLDAELGAALIEAVHSGRLTLAVGGEEGGEFFGVVGQDRVDIERSCLVQRLEKAHGRMRALIGHQFQINPAGGAVNGHKSIAPLVRVAHIGEVPDVSVHEVPAHRS